MPSNHELPKTTLKQAERIKDHAERVVVKSCLIAGLEVTQAPSIRLQKPMRTKDGGLKSVHQPDCKIVNPDNPNEYYVLEVSNGNGNTPHKLDQQELVKRAGIDNHIVVTADIWRYLEKHIDNPEMIKSIWQHITDWK